MILKGTASEILHDYADGNYTLHVEENGDIMFLDQSGNIWELDPQVLYYLSLVERQAY